MRRISCFKNKKLAKEACKRLFPAVEHYVTTSLHCFRSGNFIEETLI